MTKVICSYVESKNHLMLSHPEHPQRFERMRDWLEAPPYSELSFIKVTPALYEEILGAHSPEMLLSLKIACSMGLQEIEPAPTFVTEDSCEAMVMAAGGVLTLSRQILDHQSSARRGFAIIRPPGHHADRDKPMGFCLLNNTAIGVADALAKGLQRIAIIDFDGHHGNGTQAIFQNDPHVGFFSMHQENFYPNSGLIDNQVPGRIINLPLPFNTGDYALDDIGNRLLKPWIASFLPEMLFVSAGFDGHFADPLTGLGFSTQGYYKLAKLLIGLADEVCQGRLLFILEGGYDSLALKESIQAVLCAMVNEIEFPDTLGENPYHGESIDDRLTFLSHLHQIESF